MTLKSWLCDERSKTVEVPDQHPEHLVDELLDVIDLSNGGYPTQEQWQAILRLKNSIREETHG